MVYGDLEGQCKFYVVYVVYYVIVVVDFVVVVQFGFDGVQGGDVGYVIDGFVQQVGGIYGWWQCGVVFGMQYDGGIVQGFVMIVIIFFEVIVEQVLVIGGQIVYVKDQGIGFNDVYVDFFVIDLVFCCCMGCISVWCDCLGFWLFSW